MKIYTETKLFNFNFWAGATTLAKLLTKEEFDTIEHYLEDLFYYKAPSETEINDMFWFEQDLLVEVLGYENYEEFLKERQYEN